MDVDAKMGGIEKQNQAFRIISVAIFKVSLDRNIWWNMDPKVIPTSSKIVAAGAQGPD